MGSCGSVPSDMVTPFRSARRNNSRWQACASCRQVGSHTSVFSDVVELESDVTRDVRARMGGWLWLALSRRGTLIKGGRVLQ